MNLRPSGLRPDELPGRGLVPRRRLGTLPTGALVRIRESSEIRRQTSAASLAIHEPFVTTSPYSRKRGIPTMRGQDGADLDLEDGGGRRRAAPPCHASPAPHGPAWVVPHEATLVSSATGHGRAGTLARVPRSGAEAPGERTGLSVRPKRRNPGRLRLQGRFRGLHHALYPQDPTCQHSTPAR